MLDKRIRQDNFRPEAPQDGQMIPSSFSSLLSLTTSVSLSIHSLTEPSNATAQSTTYKCFITAAVALRTYQHSVNRAEWTGWFAGRTFDLLRIIYLSRLFFLFHSNLGYLTADLLGTINCIMLQSRTTCTRSILKRH